MSKNYLHRTAFHQACVDNKLDEAKALWEKNDQVHLLPDGDCWYPIHNACYNGTIELVQFLWPLYEGRVQNKHGMTPLYIACANGRIDIVDYLLKEGANPYVPAWNGTTPLDIAREQNHKNCASIVEKFCETYEAKAISSDDEVNSFVVSPITNDDNNNNLSFNGVHSNNNDWTENPYLLKQL